MFWNKEKGIDKTLEHITPEHIVVKAFFEIQKENKEEFIKYTLIEEKVNKLWLEAQNYSEAQYQNKKASDITLSTMKNINNKKYKQRAINMVWGTSNAKNNLRGSYCIANKKIYSKLVEEYNFIVD